MRRTLACVALCVAVSLPDLLFLRRRIRSTNLAACLVSKYRASATGEGAMKLRMLLVLTLLVLVIAPGALAQQLLYIHTDHLDTPRMVTDGTGTAVWRWDQIEPFGDNAPDEDPDGNATPMLMPLRFPGQYFDKETN